MAERGREMSSAEIAELYKTFANAEASMRNKENGGEPIDDSDSNQAKKPAIGSRILPTNRGIDPTIMEQKWRERR